MNLVEKYLIIHILKTLHTHLLNVSQRNYRQGFANARKELLKMDLCKSMSVHLKDQNTAMVLANIADQQYVLLWDLRKKEIVYKGVKNHATS